MRSELFESGHKPNTWPNRILGLIPGSSDRCSFRWGCCPRWVHFSKWCLMLSASHYLVLPWHRECNHRLNWNQLNQNTLSWLDMVSFVPHFPNQSSHNIRGLFHKDSEAIRKIIRCVNHRKWDDIWIQTRKFSNDYLTCFREKFSQRIMAIRSNQDSSRRRSSESNFLSASWMWEADNSYNDLPN